MQRWLTQRWYQEHARAPLLAPLASLYGALLALRRRAYASGWVGTEHVGKPVVVVGNLTVGGTGKTPLTIWLARQLTAAGLKVGIVSRGYGGAASGPSEVLAQSDWRQVGDEPLILARRTACRTVVAKDRVAGARALIAGGAEVILADDGLQHLRLGRDCEIVVIDGARGFGNGRVLPAGPLREPRAWLPQPDAFVVNGTAAHASLRLAALQPAPLAMELIAQEAARVDGREPPHPLAHWRGQQVHAVAGIGNPTRFFTALRSHGIELIEHPFADHHRLSAADLVFADRLPVLMTEKDAVKCGAFADERLWYVPVAAHFDERDGRELLTRVLSKVRRASHHGDPH